ncbi:MAG: hypothetical protein KDA87_02615 [Planctomycetales bacterium]|nr:hypothetical protein [Planctomycetales bacterium]
MDADHSNKHFLVRTIVTVLASIAACISGWLAWHSLFDPEAVVAACGTASGCNEVLASRWSVWFGLPVSLPASLIYLTLAGIAGPWGPWTANRRWWAHALSATIALSVLWFVGLQVFLLHAYCKLCLSVHACGLAIGLVWLGSAWQRTRTRPKSETPPSVFATAGSAAETITPVAYSRQLLLAAVSCGFILLAGQLASKGPDSHVVTEIALADTEVMNSEEPAVSPRIDSTPSPAGTNSPFDSSAARVSKESNSSSTTTVWKPEVAPVTQPRIVPLAGGVMKVPVHLFPHLGPDDAELVAMELFDYTCKSCRETSKLIDEAVQHYNGRLLVLVVPSPMHRDCNGHMKAEFKDHPLACEYARLAMAVWKAKPTAFAEFHQIMMKDEKVPLPDTAKQLAINLVGEDALRTAYQNPQVMQPVQVGTKTYGLVGGGIMPKMIFRTKQIMQGRPRNLPALLEVMERNL